MGSSATELLRAAWSALQNAGTPEERRSFLKDVALFVRHHSHHVEAAFVEELVLYGSHEERVLILEALAEHQEKKAAEAKKLDEALESAGEIVGKWSKILASALLVKKAKPS